MQVLQVLEEKIAALVKVLQSCKKENEELKKAVLAADKKNKQLKAQVEMLESSMLSDEGRLKELDKEKELTKTVVDDLIKNIDALVESGK